MLSRKDRGWHRLWLRLREKPRLRLNLGSESRPISREWTFLLKDWIFKLIFLPPLIHTSMHIRVTPNVHFFFKILRSSHVFRCEMTRLSRICLSFCNILSFWRGTPQMFVIFPKMPTILRGVLKPSVGALRNEDQLIGLDESLRLKVYFLTLC